MSNFQRIRKSWALKSMRKAVKGKEIILVDSGQVISGLVRKLIFKNDKVNFHFSRAILYTGYATDLIEIEKSIQTLEKKGKKIETKDYRFPTDYLNLNSGNPRVYIKI